MVVCYKGGRERKLFGGAMSAKKKKKKPEAKVKKARALQAEEIRAEAAAFVASMPPGNQPCG